MRFQPGQSGNPAGMPPGSRPSSKLRTLLEGHATELIAKVVELALSGDMTALKLCLDKILPNARHEPVKVALNENASLSEHGKTLIAAMAEGHLSVEQGCQLLSGLAAQAKLVEVDDLARRLDALELTLNNQGHRRAHL